MYVGGVVMQTNMALRNNRCMCEYNDGELLQRSMTQLERLACNRFGEFGGNGVGTSADDDDNWEPEEEDSEEPEVDKEENNGSIQPMEEDDVVERT